MLANALSRFAFSAARDVLYHREESVNKARNTYEERVEAWNRATVAEDRVIRHAAALIEHLTKKA